MDMASLRSGLVVCDMDRNRFELRQVTKSVHYGVLYPAV